MLRVSIIIFLSFVFSLGAAVASPCYRIVSLSPSITELLFSLNLGDRVVGVTRYCKYPEAAATKSKIGGFLDPNYEAILGLNPTMVTLLTEQEESRRYLDSLGIATLTVNHKNVSGILDSIDLIAMRCDAKEIAEKLKQDLQGRISRVQNQIKGLSKPRTMIIVGRTGDPLSIRSVFVSGNDGFYSDLLKIAGGENVYRGATISVPTLSTESVIKLNPEVIIEIFAKEDNPGVSAQEIRDSWNQVSQVEAVKNHKVFVLDDYYFSIPGPRFVEVLEKFADIIHR